MYFYIFKEAIMEKSRIQLALDAHKIKGLDCCESVFTTYCDLLGVPYALALAISDCYGSNTGINGVFDSYENLLYFRYMYVCAGYGIDLMFGNCGALCGAQLCAAVRNNPINKEVPRDILAAFPLCDKLYELFTAETKGDTCGSLTDAKKKSVKPYGCDKAIRLAAKLVEDMVFPGMFEKCEFDDLPDWDFDASVYWPAGRDYMSVAGREYLAENRIEQTVVLDPRDLKFANSTVEMTMGSERIKAMRPSVEEVIGKMAEYDALGDYTEGEYYYRGIYLEAMRDEDEELLLASFWGLAKCCKETNLGYRLMDMASFAIQKMDDWGYREASAFGTALVNYAYARYTLDDPDAAMDYIRSAEKVFIGRDKPLNAQLIALNYYKGLILKTRGEADGAKAAFAEAYELISDVKGYEKEKELIKTA